MDDPATSSGSTATDILYNVHALQSLKRDQLLKLCKSHSLKSSGNKAELVAALRFHARALAATTDLDNMTTIQPTIPEEEEEEDTPPLRRSPRRSPRKLASQASSERKTMKGVILEANQDDDESIGNTMSSIRSGDAGEFGPGNSKGACYA